MPLDTTTAPLCGIHDARPFVAYARPPRLTVLTEDERALSDCEAGWFGQHGAIASEDDDQSDRWDDDELPLPRAARHGVGMDELAATAAPDIPDRATLRALMVSAGHLTHVAKQRRYLLSAAALREGIGRNVLVRRGFRFPIIFPENVALILRTLDWEHIKARVESLPTGRERMEYLARWHRGLPVKTLAHVAGCPVRSMERALARAASD